MDKMLRRIIGEDMNLIAITDPDLNNVKVDPGQIEQVIVNLAVNARDAMPKGGKLVIETMNVELESEYSLIHPEVTTGPYAMIAVTDTGTGITKEHVQHIFDPFYTTKDIDEGTGLGLSTVYGIIKQSGGYIYVYSEEGLGTTFKIYLPVVAEEAEQISHRVELTGLPRGTESILVVEDEDNVRKLAVRILKKQGYSVRDARTGGDALILCQELEKPFDLVLTDVIMPNMNGPDLVKKLKKIWDDVTVLYMSGYTADAIVRNGILKKDTLYMQKPFSPVDLARKVRIILDKSKED